MMDEFVNATPRPAPWLDPTPQMLGTPEFEAVWQVIKTWDINVPTYSGYCGATGNHVRAILDALTAVNAHRAEPSDEDVERAARAAPDWEQMSDTARERHRERIRAAIAAMRAKP